LADAGRRVTMTRHQAQNRGRWLARRGDARSADGVASQTEDVADQAIKRILDAHVGAPEKPFLMYCATGAGHAPHDVPKEWADGCEGQFDGGWDAYRETVFQRQKECEGLSCGHDCGAPAAEGYAPPFAFTGTIHRVAIDVAGGPITDGEAEMARLMAQR
jgi:Sulfatase